MDEISIQLTSQGKLVVTNGCLLIIQSGYAVLPILDKYCVSKLSELTPAQKDDLWAELLKETTFRAVQTAQ